MEAIVFTFRTIYFNVAIIVVLEIIQFWRILNYEPFTIGISEIVYIFVITNKLITKSSV